MQNNATTQTPIAGHNALTSRKNLSISTDLTGARNITACQITHYCCNSTSLNTSVGSDNHVCHLKNNIQLDATYYFIMLMLGSTCFGHHYAHHQELTTIALVTT